MIAARPGVGVAPGFDDEAAPDTAPTADAAGDRGAWACADDGAPFPGAPFPGAPLDGCPVGWPASVTPAERPGVVAGGTAGWAASVARAVGVGVVAAFACFEAAVAVGPGWLGRGVAVGRGFADDVADAKVATGLAVGPAAKTGSPVGEGARNVQAIARPEAATPAMRRAEPMPSPNDPARLASAAEVPRVFRG
jgi:hypothetical protein